MQYSQVILVGRNTRIRVILYLLHEASLWQQAEPLNRLKQRDILDAAAHKVCSLTFFFCFH
jgi:hypothetical protein